MGVAEDLGDALTKDSIEAAEKLGDQELIREVTRELAATSSTSEEASRTPSRLLFYNNNTRHCSARKAGYEFFGAHVHTVSEKPTAHPRFCSAISNRAIDASV